MDCVVTVLKSTPLSRILIPGLVIDYWTFLVSSLELLMLARGLKSLKVTPTESALLGRSLVEDTGLRTTLQYVLFFPIRHVTTFSS